MPKKIILKSSLSPGDIVTLTAAVRDLHLSNKGKFVTAVDTPCPALWENNPYITKLNKKEAKVIECDYPIIHESNTGALHFIHGYAKFLENKLKVNIELSAFKGDIHISDEEKSWMSQMEEMGIDDDFWIIVAGGKYDFTAKWWNPDSYQRVVDHFKGRITFVQTGDPNHFHTPLKGVVNLIGKTDQRQFVRLVYHSVGILCPITFAMHLAAAVPVKEGRPLNRACVVTAGGREPQQWEAYPHHRFLSTNGALRCCDNGGCWASRCQKVNDGDEKDIRHICENPVEIRENLQIPKCQDMIKPHDVIRAIEMYYEGGALKYGSDVERIEKLK